LLIISQLCLLRLVSNYGTLRDEPSVRVVTVSGSLAQWLLAVHQLSQLFWLVFQE